MFNSLLQMFDGTRPISGVITWVAICAGWITHIFYCLLASEYMLLVAGALVFPIGTLHGWGLWFGIW